VVDSAPQTIVVDKQPVSATEAAYMNGVWTGRLEALTVAGLAAFAYDQLKSESEDYEYADLGLSKPQPDGVDYERELRETHELMDELRRELASAADPLADAIERPRDGTYAGESAEDDDGDQSVSTTLTFERDGAIRGSGHDGVDGRYRIYKGQWSGKRVAWIESYAEGFTVALRGQVRPDGSIVALWASSRGVGGSAELSPPK